MPGGQKHSFCFTQVVRKEVKRKTDSIDRSGEIKENQVDDI